MDGAGKALIPTAGEIVGVNRRMIFEFGGEFFDADQNLMNPGSLYSTTAINALGWKSAGSFSM
ncbi:MAG: hypothetical protein M1546_27460 [Chloroflexi bacterium]|nr:hypothetical protein [Chloroflexota bacterium]